MPQKTVLITGSSKGLGRALAIEFAKQGFGVIIHGRDEKALASVARQIAKEGSQAISIPGELTSESTLASLADAARRESIDILVNNAGIYLGKPATETTPEELREVMAVNFFAPAILTKKILPYFIERGRGLIVNINSIAGKQGSLGETAYAASKHALKGFSDSLKFEITSQGIKILDVYSGALATSMTAGRKNPELFIRPEEAAKVIVANCVNYESLRIDELDIHRARYK